MGTFNISEEERERRSLNAKELVASGRLGGSEFGKLGGRPRKKRASEIIAEKATDEADKIWNKLQELMFESESEKVSLEAIKQVISIEEQERKVEVEEEVRYEQLSHNRLLELVIGNLEQLHAEGRLNIADIIDAEIVEERPAIGSG